MFSIITAGLLLVMVRLILHDVVRGIHEVIKLKLRGEELFGDAGLSAEHVNVD